jgi:hypothetical protein
LPMASSLLVPLHFSHASHLDLPLKSNIPGRSRGVRERERGNDLWMEED